MTAPLVVTDEATEDERERARALYGSDDIEVDDNARVSRADSGVWVAGWLWVADEVTS